MARGHPLDRVRFVKYNKIVLEEQPPARLVLYSAQLHEKQGVVQHQHVRRQDPAARALIEAGRPALLHKVGLIAAQFRRAQAALGADLLPHFRLRLQVEIRQAAVPGFLDHSWMRCNSCSSEEVKSLPACGSVRASRRVQR
jgi:hypothetical protein